MITNNIAPMRQAWINELRNKAAEYIANTDQIIGFEVFNLSTDDKNTETYNDFRNITLKRVLKTDILRVQIMLLLPFKTELNNETLAEKTNATLSKINVFLGITNPSKNQIEIAMTDLSELINDFKNLLKYEWNKTKELKEIE